jgi:hypothetical protein
MRTSFTTFDVVRASALGLGIFGASYAIAAAQETAPYTQPGPAAWRWQTAWDRGNYDRNHVVVGTVGSFQPYRLTLLNQQGDSMTIDLKNGTVIRPTGMTPSAGQRVAVFGYWSNGTFIANRVVLHG